MELLALKACWLWALLSNKNNERLLHIFALMLESFSNLICFFRKEFVMQFLALFVPLLKCSL
jgi:hypothetical protein